MAYGDYRQSWERVPEGPKPDAPPVYAPSTGEVRRQWNNAVRSDLVAARSAEFDRWLASVRADAWDEGNRAHPKFGVNPYR